MKGKEARTCEKAMTQREPKKMEEIIGPKGFKIDENYRVSLVRPGLSNKDNEPTPDKLRKKKSGSEGFISATAVTLALSQLAVKDFPIMLKKVGSWIGSAKKYINNIQNEVSNIEIDENKIEKKDEKNDKQ